MSQDHGTRAHSKYSASGAERWLNCPGSVSLCEGLPDKDTQWSLEGTLAHEVLENMMIFAMKKNIKVILPQIVLRFDNPKITTDMILHTTKAANFILDLHHKTESSGLMVETRVYLDFIDPQMFGTFDGAVIDHFGTLHVFDFKYGQSVVSPKENSQMIFYGIGLAEMYGWNFSNVRLWIIQPRIRGYDGPVFWDVPIKTLQGYVQVFKDGVDRVRKNPHEYVEGSWCHWCKGKTLCPLKTKGKIEKAQAIFSAVPLPQIETDDFTTKESDYGKEESFEEDFFSKEDGEDFF